MILKDTCKIDLDIILLRLGYPISQINSISAEKIDVFEVLRKLHSDRKCSRSGCFQSFKEINNDVGCCSYHPGRMKGMSLSCCRKKNFNEKGCKCSYHDGSFYDTVYSKREELLPIISPQLNNKPQVVTLPPQHATNKIENMNNIECKLPKIQI